MIEVNCSSSCSPCHAERQVPAGGHRCLHRFPLGRDCPATAQGAEHVLLQDECRHPAPSRTGNAAGMGASMSSDAVGIEKGIRGMDSNLPYFFCFNVT